MRVSASLVASLLAWALAAACCFAQETRPAEPPARQEGAVLEWLTDPVFVHLEVIEGDFVLTLAGSVHVEVGGFELTCDNLVAWLAGKPDEEAGDEPPDAEEVPGTGRALDAARRVVHELYAEGTVVINEGSKVLRADRAFYDFVHDRGILIDAKAVFPVTSRSGEELPLKVRADEVRVLARDRIEASHASVTASPFGRPGHRFEARELRIRQEPPRLVRIGGETRQIRNVRLDASGNTFYAGDVPVLWVPDFGADTATASIFRYVEDVRLGRSNEFGLEAEVRVGDDIGGGDGGPWGHWSVPLFYLSKRGLGAGIDVTYDTDDYRGELLLRYQRDDGRDKLFGVPPTKNRGRISWWHRHRLPWDVQLDLELNLFSDRGFYPTYYEDEFKQEKPPENLVFLKKRFFNSQVSGLFNTRFNDWLTVVEKQPEVRHDLVTQPLFDLFDSPVYLNTSARVTKGRLELDEALDVMPRATWRVDLDTLFEYPFFVGPFKLTPFGGVRWTWYTRTLQRREESRLGLTFGATLTLQAWKDYEAEGGLFGLDGLRHVIYPELTFRDTVGVAADVRPDRLVPLDEVDTVSNEQSIELRVRNLFQTVRYRRGDARLPYVDTFLDLETAFAFYPNPSDNAGDPWGNLDVELLVRFSEDLQLASDFEASFDGGGFEVFNVAGGYTPSPELQTYGGFRHFRDTYDAVFLQINWRVEEKWLTTLETSYDFEKDRGIEHRFSLARIGPSFVFEITFKADLGENDYGVSVAFLPRLLFDPTLRPRALQTDPRFLYLGTGITR